VPRKLLAAILGIAALVPATTQLVDVLPHWGKGRSLGFHDVSVTFETV
jgi:hypothetical protein